MIKSVTWDDWLRKNSYLLVSLLFSLLQLVVIFIVYGVRITSDSPSYIQTVNFFIGKSSVKPHRLLTPLGPLIATIFQPIGGIVIAFGIENGIFYVLSSILVYLIGEKLYSNKQVAFFASVLFSSATSVITWGIAVLTDMGVWFFYLLSIFLTLQFLKEKKVEILAINGVICGLGFLMKENSVASVIFFILSVSFSSLFHKDKFRAIVLFGSLFLIPIIIIQAIVFQLFQYTYLDWYVYNLNLYSEAYFTFPRFIIGLVLAFTLMLPLFVVGLWREVKEKDKSTISRLRKYLFLTISSSIPIFAWSLLIERFIFLLFPTIIPLSCYGLLEFQNALNKKSTNKIARGITILILVIYIVFNNIFLYFRPELLMIYKGAL